MEYSGVKTLFKLKMHKQTIVIYSYTPITKEKMKGEKCNFGHNIELQTLHSATWFPLAITELPSNYKVHLDITHNNTR
jgi:hypothetical protein